VAKARASGWEARTLGDDSDEGNDGGDNEGDDEAAAAKAAIKRVGHAVRAAVLDCMATAWLQKQWPWAKAEIETTFQLAAERRLR
jgi:hypothetical protein